MDKNKVGNIVDYIKNKRETKIVNEIKRLSNNNICGIKLKTRLKIEINV